MVEFDIDNMPGKEFPDIATQKTQIQHRLSESMNEGQTWYIIDAKWFKTFKYFVGIDDTEHHNIAINPGPIDNTLLLDEDGITLKRGLVEKLDYVVIPFSVWTLLYSWYGMKENQQPIGRKIVSVARPPATELRLEVYKVELALHDNPDFEKPQCHSFSIVDTISQIEEVCRMIFQVPNHQLVELRCFYDPNQSRILDKDKTIFEESLDANLPVVMEVLKTEDAAVEQPKSFTKPALPKTKDVSRIPRVLPSNSRPTGPVTRYVTSMSHGSLRTAEGRGLPCTPGLSGLMNLGNTCFLNSILQCLSNCGPITQYFLDGTHENEINDTNPLGKAGQIARSFADVIAMMWSGKYSITVPHYFKFQLTKFAPQFVGCQQHDAQELLTFLLDGLHEDLNRIKDKPYCQNEDNDVDDDELARMSWEYFLMRNNSIIIDHFHGMLKSRVVCPDCEKVSIKFDTFSTLSLPLPPQRCDRTMTVRYVPYDQSLKVTDLCIVIPKKGTIRDMMFELNKLTMVKPELMVIAEINKSHFHKFFSRDDSIESIDDRDKIYMYDMPELDNKFTLLPVVLWEIQDPARNTHFLNSLFGTPFLMVLPRGPMYFKVLYDKICERMTRSCPGFLNSNIGGFSMDYELGGGDSNRTVFNNYLFTPVLVNTFCYENITKIADDEEALFDVPDNFGRDHLALQITKEVRTQHFRDPPAVYVDHSYGLRPSPKTVSLQDCVVLFTTTEKLGENNAWHCPRCNKKKRATKKLDLWKLPNILIFHLKRFAFNETRKEKLDTKVDFPLTGLNIDRLVVNKHKENHVYDLIGVCNHYGSLMGGHYTANCKSYKDGQWYCFDDNAVTPISPESVQTETAYVLFYQRRPQNRVDPDEEKVDL